MVPATGKAVRDSGYGYGQDNLLAVANARPGVGTIVFIWQQTSTAGRGGGLLMATGAGIGRNGRI